MPKTTLKTTKPAGNRRKTKWGLIALNALVIVGLIGSTVYFFNKYNDAQAELAMSQDQRNEKLVTEVGKVYSLPKDEKAVVALVADEEKFKAEYKVFTDAKKDDYLLLYEKAGLAILYRPSEKKVIATAPLSIKKELSVALIGSDTQVANAEKTLEEKVGSEVNVSSKSGGITTYSSTVVVDVKGTQSTSAQQLATLLGGTVGSLPEGETAPENADFVIVLATPAAQ